MVSQRVRHDWVTKHSTARKSHKNCTSITPFPLQTQIIGNDCLKCCVEDSEERVLGLISNSVRYSRWKMAILDWLYCLRLLLSPSLPIAMWLAVSPVEGVYVSFYWLCFFNVYIFYLAAPGLSCGMWTLSCSMWELVPQLGIELGPCFGSMEPLEQQGSPLIAPTLELIIFHVLANRMWTDVTHAMFEPVSLYFLVLFCC